MTAIRFFFLVILIFTVVVSCTINTRAKFPRRYIASYDCNKFHGIFSNRTLSSHVEVRKRYPLTLMSMLGIKGLVRDENYKVKLYYVDEKVRYKVFDRKGGKALSMGNLDSLTCIQGMLFSPRVSAGTEESWLIMAHHHSDILYIDDRGDLVIESEISHEGFIFFISMRYFDIISHKFLASPTRVKRSDEHL